MGRNINRSKKVALNRVSVAFKLATLGVVALAVWFSGCSREITGEWQNSPPEVRFVNIPPDGTVFSLNPVINWVGTDIDGRILEYQFVVVLETDIPGGMAPELYAASIPLAEWTVLNVSLDTTQTSATVRLAADLSDPVNTIVQQFVFLRAKDDDGAFSPIVYRLFGRKNHFPETRIQPFLVFPPYVNASFRSFDFGGVPTLWFGNDSLDFQGDQPQLEFEWLLFGPYTVAESTLIMDNFRKSVFLTNQRTYAIGDTLIDTVFDFTQTDTAFDTTFDSSVTPPVIIKIDTIKTPAIDTILHLEVDTSNSDLSGFGRFQSVLILDSVYKLDSVLDPTGSSTRLIEQSFNPLTGESWTTQQSAVFFNLFDNDPLVKLTGPSADTTRVRTFLFWVRSRDDAVVPDPTPSFGVFNVIEPRHERDILMVDWEKAVRNQSQQGLVIPCVDRRDPTFRGGLDTSKRVMSEYLTAWLGSGSVGDGSSFIFDTTTFNPCGKDSGLIPPGANCLSALYNPRHASNDYSTQGALPTGSVYAVTLRDILKHKVVIFLKENLADGLPVKVLTEGETWIVSGALSGVNFWTMSRASFQSRGFDNPAPFCNDISVTGIPFIYSIVFGLEQACNQGWYGMNRRLNIRNEDFIGAIPSGAPGVSSTEFPALSIDPQRLKNFLRWADETKCEFEFLTQYPFIDSVAALPAVGYVVPRISVGAEAIYLFKSRFGEGRYPFFDLQTGDGNYNGTVVAIRRDAGFFRVSHWEFTPMAFDTASFQVAFNSMMDWLFETWGGPPTGGGSPVSRRTPQTMYSINDYSLATLSNWNRLQAQEQIDELTPPGRRGVRDQYEAEIYIKKYMERRKLEAQKAGF